MPEDFHKTKPRFLADLNQISSVFQQWISPQAMVLLSPDSETRNTLIGGSLHFLLGQLGS
jgi:hypothetical protein